MINKNAQKGRSHYYNSYFLLLSYYLLLLFFLNEWLCYLMISQPTAYSIKTINILLELRNSKTSLWIEIRSVCSRKVSNVSLKIHNNWASLTWSKSCFPVVDAWIANSSSASIVVTRTLTCKRMIDYKAYSLININNYSRTWEDSFRRPGCEKFS